jgi:hypothetical protein
MVQRDPGADIAHIRSLMERSTRFISLSGLSGVFAGAVALAGAWVAHGHMALAGAPGADVLTYGSARAALRSGDALLWQLVFDGAVVLAIALVGAAYFTWRRSRRLDVPLWAPGARKLLWNLAVPLVAGGIFCLVLLDHGLPGLVAPATLVFYGLALINAAKYTLDEVHWLGLSELALGLVALLWLGAGLLFWALGFGVLHILYGGLMWMRHERTSAAGNP